MKRPAPSAHSSIFGVVSSVIAGVSALENEMIRGEWLPPAWVAKYGPRAPNLKDAMVYMHRGWQAVETAVRKKTTDLDGIQAAAVELAAAAVKLVTDLQYLRDRNVQIRMTLAAADNGEEPEVEEKAA